MAQSPSSSSPLRRWSPPWESSRTSSRRRKSWWRTCKKPNHPQCVRGLFTMRTQRFFQDCLFPNDPRPWISIAHLLYQKTNCNHLSIIISIYYLVDRLHLLFTVLTYKSKGFLIPSPPVLLQSTHLDNILLCLWGKTSKKRLPRQRPQLHSHHMAS